MWFLYVPLVALALVGVGGLAFGALPLGIICLVIAGLFGIVAVTSRARSMRLDSVDAPSGIPGTRESSYEPRSDPGQTPTGGSTGTP